MRAGQIFSTFLLAFGVVVLAIAGQPRAADSDATETAALKQIQSEMRQMRAERKRDRQVIRSLEIKVQQLESKDSRVETTTQQLQNTDQKLKETTLELQQTNLQVKTLQTKVDAPIAPSQFGSAFDSYLGSRRFVVNGTFAGSFQYDKATATNTFTLNWTPQINYELNKWTYFVGQLSGSIGANGASTFTMPVASIMMFFNDYMELYAGIFDNPFGNWYEDRSAPWVNRFATAPLPFDGEPVGPPTDVGAQLRGGYQWGALGQDVDYTVWVSNGPSYDASLPNAAIGQTLNAFNGVTLNTNGKAFGGRFRFYPIPLRAEWGRLQLAAATLNGKWQNNFWYNAWGVNLEYQKDALAVYGAWLTAYRQMPTSPLASGLPAGSTVPGHDNRQGWYLEVDYALNQLAAKMTMLPSPVEQFMARMLAGVRYSGVNQRAIVASEINTTPAPAFSGSPSIFSPHSREVAMVLDYYFSPSIVWQNELDFEIPQNGGSLVTFGGPSGSTPIYTPFGTTHNDRTFITQLTVGF
jgi:hypothetical protein